MKRNTIKTILLALLSIVLEPTISRGEETTNISTRQLNQLIQQNRQLLERVELLEKKVERIQPESLPNDFSAPITHQAMSKSVVAHPKNVIEKGKKDPEMYFGYSVFLANPNMKESFRATTLNDGGTPGPAASGDDTLSLVPLEEDHDPSHRIWLGVTGANDVGMRATYWTYDQQADPFQVVSSGPTGLGTGTRIPSATVTSVIFPATITGALPGDVLTVQNGLDVDTLDVEGTLDLQFGYTDLRIGGGLRHASVEQTYRSSILRGGAEEASLNWLRKFEGIGPTISVDGRRRLGKTGLSAVGRVRGALLYGEKTIEREATGTLAGPVPSLVLPSGAPASVAMTEGEDFAAAIELGLGAEWRHDLGNIGHFYIQGMYEGQLWTAAGEPTLTFLGFEGLNLSLGMSRSF